MFIAVLYTFCRLSLPALRVTRGILSCVEAQSLAPSPLASCACVAVAASIMAVSIIIVHSRQTPPGLFCSYVPCYFIPVLVVYFVPHFRTHFNYEQADKNELSFRKGDIFHVVDTLNLGVVGGWQVHRIGE